MAKNEEKDNYLQNRKSPKVVLTSRLCWLGVSLPDEIHRVPRFPFRILRCALGMEFPQQESHIICQGAHGLHAFCILCCLARITTISDVPILRCHHRHVHHHEGHVHRLESCRSTTTTTHGNGCSGFVHKQRACREEQTLHQR